MKIILKETKTEKHFHEYLKELAHLTEDWKLRKLFLEK